MQPNFEGAKDKEYMILYHFDKICCSRTYKSYKTVNTNSFILVLEKEVSFTIINKPDEFIQRWFLRIQRWFLRAHSIFKGPDLGPWSSDLELSPEKLGAVGQTHTITYLINHCEWSLWSVYEQPHPQLV